MITPTLTESRAQTPQVPVFATGHLTLVAEVVFNLPLERAYHYLVPPEMDERAQPGTRVVASFGPRERMGWIIARPTQSRVPELKSIRRVLDEVPVIDDERQALADAIRRHYGCSLGEALALMAPSDPRLTVGLAEALKTTTSQVEPSTSTTKLKTLSRHQRQALATVLAALNARESRTILVHGVNASGKTELYLRAIQHVLELGRSAIYLVPEIALTPQTIDRLRERFGDQVAVWHSKLTTKARRATWQALYRGTYRVVLGARSAITAPVRNLGLIIIDEEHDQAYKQEDAPRVHARDVAILRARLTRATVVLGSATPSLESYYAAQRGDATLVQLPERVAGRVLPRISVIDMHHARRDGPRGNLSIPLQHALRHAVEHHEQAMLLLNRRGFARVGQCHTCGAVVRCPHCDVPLVYHAASRTLRCHYCEFQMAAPELCSRCKKGTIRFRGAGTERIESDLHRLFPATAIARMDRDTTTSRESHRELYDAVTSHTVELLVGTHMIAKGLDFPQVTVVGIVSADTALNLPDFRAGERTFALLTQMAGRARGERPGRVFIQTYYPQHSAIVAAASHNAKQFYHDELAMRRRLKLPPYSHLVELLVYGSAQVRTTEVAEALVAALRQAAVHKRITVLGPAPARVARVRRTYRISLLLKGARVEPMIELIRATLQPGRKFRGLPVLIDVDPR